MPPPDLTSPDMAEPAPRGSLPTSSATLPVGTPRAWQSLVAMVAVAVNLRLAIAGVPPLVDAISGGLGIGGAAIGALTTLPVLCMGIFAPAAQSLSHRFGAPVAVLVAVIAVTAGSALRLGGGTLWVLYASTIVAGVGIAIGGTLLPSLVKSLFPPQRAGLVTGLYMCAMMLGATVSAAAAVPLQQALGSWQGSLASWSVIGLVGLAVWSGFLVVLRRGRGSTDDTPAGPGPAEPAAARPTQAVVAAEPAPAATARGRLPLRHPTALLVAGYLSLQSWCFYSSLAWLSPTYVEHGWGTADAGYLLAAFSAGQFVSGLLAPALSDRTREHRSLLAPASTLGLVGTIGVAFAPHAAPWLWAIVLGLGQGAAFALGLVLLVRYAGSAEASGRLSAMAFLVSYTLASFGPLVMGAIHDGTGGFRDVWLVLAGLSLIQLAVTTRLHPRLAKIS